MSITGVQFRLRFTAALLASLLASACATTEPSCMSPQTRNLDSAISAVQSNLSSGCEMHFDRYYDDLLTIAEGDPRITDHAGRRDHADGRGR